MFSIFKKNCKKIWILAWGLEINYKRDKLEILSLFDKNKLIVYE